MYDRCLSSLISSDASSPPGKVAVTVDSNSSSLYVGSISALPDVVMYRGIARPTATFGLTDAGGVAGGVEVQVEVEVDLGVDVSRGERVTRAIGVVIVSFGVRGGREGREEHVDGEELRRSSSRGGLME